MLCFLLRQKKYTSYYRESESRIINEYLNKLKLQKEVSIINDKIFMYNLGLNGSTLSIMKVITKR